MVMHADRRDSECENDRETATFREARLHPPHLGVLRPARGNELIPPLPSDPRSVTRTHVCWLPPGYIREIEDGHYFVGSSLVMHYGWARWNCKEVDVQKPKAKLMVL